MTKESDKFEMPILGMVKECGACLAARDEDTNARPDGAFVIGGIEMLLAGRDRFFAHLCVKHREFALWFLKEVKHHQAVWEEKKK